jgi:hypothetical protein
MVPKNAQISEGAPETRWMLTSKEDTPTATGMLIIVEDAPMAQGDAQ